jgi:4'-phosphopantetheinyl transferase EntD
MSPSISMQTVPASVEDARALAAQYLLPEELALLSPRAAPKRIAEFVAGRVAARRAVARLSGQDPRSPLFRILREGDGPTGLPTVVTSASGASLYVSISHADGLAIAAAAPRRIGIDLATIQPQAQSFLDETFSPRELGQWATWLKSDPNSPLTVTTAFAAKEAALKWLGTGFGMALRGIEVVPDAACRSRSPQEPRRLSVAINETRKGCWSLEARQSRICDKISILLLDFQSEHSWCSNARSPI